MQFSPYSSPIRLVFQEQISSRNLEGFPWVGALNDGGVGKNGDFRPSSHHISETVQLIPNRNVYTCFRLVPKSITLDYLEWINGRFRITISSEMAISAKVWANAFVILPNAFWTFVRIKNKERVRFVVLPSVKHDSSNSGCWLATAWCAPRNDLYTCIYDQNQTPFRLYLALLWTIVRW